MAYFKGECMTNTMLRIKGMERDQLLVEEQLVKGWDNLLRGKLSKQWKIQQKKHIN